MYNKGENFTIIKQLNHVFDAEQHRDLDKTQNRICKNKCKESD